MVIQYVRRIAECINAMWNKLFKVLFMHACIDYRMKEAKKWVLY